MKKKYLKLLKLFLPILIGLALIVISYNATTAEEREQIVKHLKEANYFWVGISVVLGIISHISRAIRWKFMLKPIGHTPGFTNSFLIVLMSYFTNLGIPRSGEILRATALNTYEDVPFEKGFGTIVAERIIDMCMLLLIIGIAFFAQTETLLSILQEKQIPTNKIIIAALLGIVLILIFVFFIKKSKHFVALKIKSLVQGLLEGVFSVFKMPKKGWFIFHTFLIWSCYVGMFWIIKFCFPETQNLAFSIILVAFIGGAFAMSATNGGLGLFPIAVSQILMIYGVSKVSAEAYGWIMWISQTLMVVVLGLFAYITIPLVNRQK